METQNNNKKSWTKPTVLTLDISNDTYAGGSAPGREVGSGDAANKDAKALPS